VPKGRSGAGGRGVFRQDAAGSVVTADAHLVEVDGFPPGRDAGQGTVGAVGAVGAVDVVVLLVVALGVRRWCRPGPHELATAVGQQPKREASSASTTWRRRLVRIETTATIPASPGSFFRPRPVSKIRARVASLLGTPTTVSPSATSR